MRLFARLPLVLSLLGAAAFTSTFLAERTVVADEHMHVEGQWTAFWGGGKVPMHLNREGHHVKGKYWGSATGRVEGTLSGNELKGEWVGDGGGGGRFVFYFSDHNHFTGTWGNGESRSNGGAWNGSRD